MNTKHRKTIVARQKGTKNTFVAIAALTLVGAGILQLLLAYTYLSAFHAPKPHGLQIAVTGQVDTVKQVTAALSKESNGAFIGTDYSNDAVGALRALKTQAVYMVYAPAYPVSQVTIASANGKSSSQSLANSLSAFDQGFQKQVRARLAANPQTAAGASVPIVAPKVEDAAPLVGGDSGASMFYAAFSAVFGGYLAAVALNLVRGKRAFTRRNAMVRAGGFVIAGVLTSAITSVLAVHGLHALPEGDFWAVSGILSLTYIGVAMFSSAIISGIGIAGTAVVILLFVILGNPASGGVVPVVLTDNGPWHWLAAVLPTGSAVSALRQALYFNGLDVARHLFVLAGYVVAGFTVLIAIGRPKTSISAYEHELAEELPETA